MVALHARTLPEHGRRAKHVSSAGSVWPGNVPCEAKWTKLA
jgi:hypothetical protein